MLKTPFIFDRCDNISVHILHIQNLLKSTKSEMIKWENL